MFVDGDLVGNGYEVKDKGIADDLLIEGVIEEGFVGWVFGCFFGFFGVFHGGMGLIRVYGWGMVGNWG